MILNINSLIIIELDKSIASTDAETLSTDFTSYFSTEMIPLYSSANEVRRLVGSFITEISDDIINQLILEYSFLAQDLSDCDVNDRWYRYINKWVSYRVAIIVLNNSEEFQSGGKAFKQLGDFSVSKEPGGSDSGLVKLLDWLECEDFKYEVALRMCGAPAITCDDKDKSGMVYQPKLTQLTERGANDINRPLIGRRWSMDWGGVPRGNNLLFAYGRKYHTNIGTREFRTS